MDVNKPQKLGLIICVSRSPSLQLRQRFIASFGNCNKTEKRNSNGSSTIFNSMSFKSTEFVTTSAIEMGLRNHPQFKIMQTNGICKGIKINYYCVLETSKKVKKKKSSFFRISDYELIGNKPSNEFDEFIFVKIKNFHQFKLNADRTSFHDFTKHIRCFR